MAAGTGLPLKIAVDTCVLMGLADHSIEAWSAVRAVRKRLRAVSFIIPPVVLQELIAHIDGSHPEKKRLCEQVLNALHQRAWPDFGPIDLFAAYHGVSEVMARRLRDEGVLPEEERNDAFFVTESALAECDYILSADRHIVSMPAVKYQRVIRGFDLNPPTVLGLREAQSF